MKKVLITGGTRGVGLNLAKMFDSKGNYQVFLTGTNGSNAEKVAKNISSNHDAVISDINHVNHVNHINNINQINHVGLELNLTDQQSISKVCNYLDNESIDIIIHNAGMLSRDSLKTVTDTRLQKLFMVNTIGPILLTQSVLPNMLKKGKGHILFFCPEYAIDKKTSMLTPYMQSKLGQTTFMKSIANMVKNTNIGVAGFWTRYGLYTDALTHRNIGAKENCMDPSIVSKMVELMIEEDSPGEINGKVHHDHEYLLSKGVDINQFKLGDNVVNLDKLFMDHLSKK